MQLFRLSRERALGVSTFYPECGQQLATEQYVKLGVDVFPGCKGVWLHATELETSVASKSRGRSTFRWLLKVLGA